MHFKHFKRLHGLACFVFVVLLSINPKWLINEEFLNSRTILLSLFSTRRICSREQRKKQLDWLATNTDDITSQSHSLFTCSREQIRQVENRLQRAFNLRVQTSYDKRQGRQILRCKAVKYKETRSLKTAMPDYAFDMREKMWNDEFLRKFCNESSRPCLLPLSGNVKIKLSTLAPLRNSSTWVKNIYPKNYKCTYLSRYGVIH